MNRGLARLTHAANLVAGGTGLVYAFMKYALRPADEFAVVNHPWQPHLLHLHVILSPFLVLVLGHVLIAHAWRSWIEGTREGRVSGLVIGSAALPMVFSGYAIQVSVTPAWRTLWIGVHLTASACWLAGFLAHTILRRRTAGA